MTDINETALPGVGLRHDFTSKSGRTVGVVSHHTGRRDLVIYDLTDPDTTIATVDLTEEEGRTLAELLGGSRIVERLEELPHQIEGLVIEWLQVTDDSPLADRTIADSEVRARTGASIVALVREGEAIPAPGADDRMHAGDTVVVVGTPEAVAALDDLLAEDRTDTRS